MSDTQDMAAMSRASALMRRANSAFAALTVAIQPPQSMPFSIHERV